MLLDAVARPRLQLLQIPAGLGHPDDGHGEVPAPGHRLQGGEDLLVGEVSGGAEEDEGVGVQARPSRALGGSAGFSRWPPNS